MTDKPIAPKSSEIAASLKCYYIIIPLRNNKHPNIYYISISCV